MSDTPTGAAPLGHDHVDDLALGRSADGVPCTGDYRHGEDRPLTPLQAQNPFDSALGDPRIARFAVG